MTKKGLFIVIEGIDGSGKSTQASLLQQHLTNSGRDALLKAEPSTGPWGQKIREILGGDRVPPAEEQLKLFLLDRADDTEKNILPALAKGQIMILDRYYFSNAAYQGAMGLDPQFILEENRKQNFPLPHRVYFIDIPVETALERIGRRNRNSSRDIFEKEEFLQKVRTIYLSMEPEGLVIIDGNDTPEAVSSRITADLQAAFPELTI